jgi:5-(aminomethyl)-3-furanmethanol phosphate kinase
MWVVKIGGSLCEDAMLPRWLELLGTLGGGRVAIVGGGAGYADAVRRAQQRWQFNDLAAHNMAVLAMAQFAYQLGAMNPALRMARCVADIRQVLQSGHTALWLPFEQQREQVDEATNWQHTSDTLALHLAQTLNAERLMLVKSCDIDPSATLDQLGEAGVVDEAFSDAACDAAFPIEVLHKADLPRMRELLLGAAQHHRAG